MKQNKTSDLKQFFLRMGVGVIFICICFDVSCLEANSSDDKALFSLMIKNQPLVEVCQKLSNKSGYLIIIDKEWEKLPITVSLKNLTLQQSLTRILKSRHLNYAIISDDKEKIISIVVRDKSISMPDSNEITSGAVNNESTLQEARISADDIEAVPPDESGKRSITEGELKSLKQSQEKVDPLDLEVVPPDNPDEDGITKRQLQEIKNNQEQINPLDIEAVPPDESGNTLITEGELIDKKLILNSE
jgi:hypothetical protein